MRFALFCVTLLLVVFVLIGLVGYLFSVSVVFAALFLIVWVLLFV